MGSLSKMEKEKITAKGAKSVTQLRDEVYVRLKSVSTSTLTTQLFKRGFRNVFMQGVAALGKLENGNLVGPAITSWAIFRRAKISTCWTSFWILKTHREKGLKLRHRDQCWFRIAAVIRRLPRVAQF